MSGILGSPLLAVLLAAGAPALAQAPAAPPGPRAPRPMAWEERRAGYFQLLKEAQARDPNAEKVLNAILLEFERHPMSRTPMENMDILGTAYAAKDPPEKLLPLVVTNAVLGWYDALRFGSPAGRKEIFSQEKFLARAFSMAGPEVQQRALAFLKGPPDPVAAAVRQGLDSAAQWKDTGGYDRTWPSAYGPERLAGTPVPPLPAAQWPAAWQEALANVRAFYQIKPAPAH